MLHKSRALLTLLFAGMLLIGSAFTLVGPAGAAPTTSRTALAAQARPCGRPHYPPCPPKPSVHVSPHNVRRGHHVFVSVRHYPARKRVVVHLAGHHRYIQLGSTRTGRHGNADLTVRIPKHIPRGGYTLYVQVGSATRAFHLNVIRG